MAGLTWLSFRACVEHWMMQSVNSCTNIKLAFNWRSVSSWVASLRFSLGNHQPKFFHSLSALAAHCCCGSLCEENLQPIYCTWPSMLSVSGCLCCTPMSLALRIVLIKFTWQNCMAKFVHVFHIAYTSAVYCWQRSTPLQKRHWPAL